MDNLTKTETTTNPDYLAVSQLSELIGDIERCATMLAEAAKKAKENCEKYKTRLRGLIT